MGNPKFNIFRTEQGGFWFNLTARNGQVLLDSKQDYTTKAACHNGIESVRRNSQVDKQFFKYSSSAHTFELYARNGQCIAEGNKYKSEPALDNGVASVQKNAPIAEILDYTTGDALSMGVNEYMCFLRKTATTILLLLFSVLGYAQQKYSAADTMLSKPSMISIGTAVDDGYKFIVRKNSASAIPVVKQMDIDTVVGICAVGDNCVTCYRTDTTIITSAYGQVINKEYRRGAYRTIADDLRLRFTGLPIFIRGEVIDVTNKSQYD